VVRTGNLISPTFLKRKFDFTHNYDVLESSDLTVHIALVAIRIIPGNRKVCSALSPGAAALSAAVLLPCLPTFSLTTPTRFEIYYSQSTNAEISRQLII
jgi:hypothetical protein